VEQLFQQVMLSSCVTLLGKSGVGKSSLLNAGLIPKLDNQINEKEAEQRKIRVIPITLQAYNPLVPKTLVQLVHDHLLQCLGSLDERASKFLDFLQPEGRNSINFSLKKFQLNGYLQSKREVFLFIFDQLEQLFSFPKEQVEELEEQFREIINPNLPDYLREELEVAFSKETVEIPREHLAVLETPVNVKFLFSIRSDRLSLLIRLRSAIPEILSSPYELKPMTRKQAKLAIEEPAGKMDNFFLHPSFSFTAGSIEKITNYIEGLALNDVEMKFYEGKIEPILLQIICRYIEEKVAPYDTDKVISEDEIDLPGILSNYYDNCLTSLNLPDKELTKVQFLIEEKLISEKDKRRLNYLESVIKEEFKVSRKVLDELVGKGLLRSIYLVGLQPSFEIAHDWLIMPILTTRKNRKTKQLQPADETLALLNERISVNRGDLELLLRRAQRYFDLGYYNDALSDYTHAISRQVEKSPTLYLERGICYHRLGRYAEAEEDLSKARQMDPDSKPILFALAVNCFDCKQYAQAIPLFNQYLQLEGPNADALNYLGIISLNEGRNLEASSFFRQVLELDPNYQIALYNLGVLHYQQSDFPEAEKCFRAALDLPSADRYFREDASCWNYLGLLYERKPDGLEDAFHAFKNAVEIFPTDNNANYNLGRLYFERQQDDAAFQCFMQIGANFSNYAETRNYLGRLYCKEGFNKFDLDNAYQCFFEASQEMPGEATYQYNLGWVCYRQEQYVLAKEWFEKAEQLRPGYADAIHYLGLIAEHHLNLVEAKAIYERGMAGNPQHLNLQYSLGRVLYAQNLLSEAANAMVKTLELDPGHADAMNYLGLIAKQQGSYEDAVRRFSQSISQQPGNFYANYNYGVLLYERQQYMEAQPFFEAALVAMPNSAESLNYLGLIAEFTGQLSKAQQHYRQAISIRPDFGLAYYNLGIVLNNSSQFEEAVGYFKEAIRLKCQPAVCYNYLGAIAFNQARYDDAIAHYQTALSLEPDYEHPLFNLAESYFTKGDYADAVKNWEKLYSLRPDDWETLWYLGLSAIRMKNFSQALSIIEELKKLESVPAGKLDELVAELPTVG
jgi:tetratricopeptide (TPR) repeat protein